MLLLYINTWLTLSLLCVFFLSGHFPFSISMYSHFSGGSGWREWFSLICMYKQKYISFTQNAQALSRHKSKVCQNGRLLVILHKIHIQTHINSTADGREKKRVRLQCGWNIPNKFCKDWNLSIRDTILHKQMECLIWFFHLYCFWFILSL